MPKISELINPPRYTRQNIIHKKEAQEQTVPNQRGLDGPAGQAPAETQGWMEMEHEGLCGAWRHSHPDARKAVSSTGWTQPAEA